MNIQGILILIALALVGIFAAVNWSVLAAPASVSLLVTRVEAPVGAILLVAMAILSALFLAYLLYLQTALVREQRLHAKALESQRASADQAEASRFDELRKYLAGELSGIETRLAETHAKTEATTRQEIADVANTVAAYLGEIDDRLERRLRAAPASDRARLT